jgi:hypothetical protein
MHLLLLAVRGTSTNGVCQFQIPTEARKTRSVDGFPSAVGHNTKTAQATQASQAPALDIVFGIMYTKNSWKERAQFP